MTTCEYCGREHNHEDCPSCGAPIFVFTGPNVSEEAKRFRLQMMSAMGIPAHLFRTDPVVRRAVTLVKGRAI